MAISKQELLHALEVVKPGLANKEVIEQSTSFAFVNGKVITYNDDLSISCPIKGLDITGAVKADQLYKLLSKIKQDGVELTIEDNELLISSGRVKAGLALDAEIKLPIDILKDHGGWVDIPEKLLENMMFVKPAASSNESTQPVITCIHATESGIVEASDGYCIARCYGEELGISEFLVPARLIAEVNRIEPTKFAEGKGRIYFKNSEKVEISCRTFFKDSYPSEKIDTLLEVEGTEIVFPEDIAEILERARVISKTDFELDESITVTLKSNEFKVTARSDSAWIKEQVPIKYKGEPIKFNLTPALLKNILSKTTTATLGKDKIKFEGEDWIFVAGLRG